MFPQNDSGMNGPVPPQPEGGFTLGRPAVEPEEDVEPEHPIAQKGEEVLDAGLGFFGLLKDEKTGK